MNNETKIIVEKLGIRRSGVYAIVNPIEKKAYIGETEDFGNRWAEHIRSLYGLEDSSNYNMVNEKGSRTFCIFTVLEHKNDVNFREKKTLSDILIAEETVYMYLFRKAGFNLYNEKNDNAGYKRKWLYQGDLSDNKLMESLQEEGTEISLSLEEKREQLNRKFEDVFYISMDEMVARDKEACICAWKYAWERAREYSNEDIDGEKRPIRISDTKQIYKICYELRIKDLAKETLLDCGLKEMSMLDMAKQGELDRLVVSKFGAYYDQSPVTILETKVYDIMHNKLKRKEILDIEIIPKEKGEDGSDGICTWAFRRLNPCKVRDILDEGEEKKPRYAILPYTESKDCAQSNESYFKYLNRGDGETMEEFFTRMKDYCDDKTSSENPETVNMAKDIFAYGYVGDAKHKKNSKSHTYPEKAFPEVVSKSEVCRALLISEFYFPKEYFDMNDFYNYYRNHTGTKLNETLRGSCSHALPVLEEDMREEFVEWIKSRESKETVSCLIAKLEYPYAIDIILNP